MAASNGSDWRHRNYCHGRQPEAWEQQLEAGIRRVQESLARGHGGRPPHPIETLIVAAGTEALEQAREAIKRKSERRRHREEARERRRELRRQKRDDEASVAHGVVFAGGALVLLALMASNPAAFWWMVFIAFGFGMAAANTFSRASRSRERRLEAERQGIPLGDGGSTAGAVGDAIQARLARIDAVGEKILAAIKSSPKVVREVVQRPEETIKALRGASAELARRERELRAVLSPEEDERLKHERDELVQRITSERDDVVRLRLGSALKALDEQLAQRAELATAVSRYEAEQTRILYTLENLHTQVLRARSADSAAASVAGAGLRLSLEQLSAEIDAVADALDAVHRADVPAAKPAMPRLDPIADEPSANPRERERA